MYIAPENSTNAIAKKTDYFKNLLETANKFMSLGNVLLAGDFNSRVGSEPVDENPQEIPFISHLLPTMEPESELPKRAFCDQVVSQHGKKLLNLCQKLNLKIANGRCPGDSLGNFT